MAREDVVVGSRLDRERCEMWKRSLAVMESGSVKGASVIDLGTPDDPRAWSFQRELLC